MNTSYSLKFSQTHFPFKKKVEIKQSENNEKNAPQYFVFLDEKLYDFKYENLNNSHVSLQLNDAFKNKVLYFPKMLEENESIMMLKTNNGIDFYQYINSKFKLLLRSNEFKENNFDDFLKGWDKPENVLMCGNFYYDKNSIGILSRDNKKKLNFDLIIKDALYNHTYPIWPVSTNLEIFGNISEANFFLADLKRNGQENIIVLNANGFNVFEFDENYDLQHLLQISGISNQNASGQKIFFPDLTAQPLKDIVLFNTSGLFIYQYQLEKQNYQILHYNSLFNGQNGWDDKHIDTIQFKDINFDGKQEMFFTGPQGIDMLSFDDFSLKWNSVLNVPKIPIANRHNYILEVGFIDSKNITYPIVFTQDQDKLYWANIDNGDKLSDNGFENEAPDGTLPNITSSIIPEIIISKITNEEKPQMLLRDQLDCSSIINAVDKDTGRASFKLPLIGLPNFSPQEKINFYFNGNKKDSDILGIGWSFPLGLITMNVQGSIFPENERYFLLLEEFPQALILDTENSTNSDYIFKLSEENSETKIHYLKNDERWEIDYQGTKQIYGRRQDLNEEAVSWDLSWKYWHSVGSSVLGQIELATAWFLTEIRSGENHAMHYTYDVNNVRAPNSDKRFTREVYLKSIYDNDGNEIIFNYLDKTYNEYTLPPLINEKGNYHLKKILTRYLAGYSVIAYNYRQDINFIYKMENGKRLLTEITQVNDPTNKPILQFFYKEMLNEHQLEKVILPTAQTSVEFSYETVKGTPYNVDKIDLICDVSNSYRIDYSPDVVLISYINNHNHVALRMFNKALTNEMYSSLSENESTRFPFLGKNSVQYYENKILDKSLAFILDYGDGKDVCLINKKKDKWVLSPKYYEFDQDSIIQIGNDFVIILDTIKFLIHVIVWDKKAEDWSKINIENSSIINTTDLLLRVSDNIFFIYNDNVVIVGYRNGKNEWQTKDIITLPGVIGGIKNVINKFNVGRDVNDQLIQNFKNNAFQVNNNFILFNRLNVEGMKMYSEIKLFLLNATYEVVHLENHRITQDDLNEISKEIEVKDDKGRKSFFTIGYEKEGDTFKIVTKSFRGAIVQLIDSECKNDEECVSNAQKIVKENVSSGLQTVFLLDLQKYLAFIKSSMVICNDVRITFNGNNWEANTVAEEESKEWSIAVADKYAFVKKNSVPESSIKLYKQDENGNLNGSLIFDLEVKGISQILNKYPVYFIQQTESKKLNLVFYDYLDMGINKKFTLPPGETLSVMSDYYTLVTHSESTKDNETVTLKLRQVTDIKANFPNTVIKSLTVNFDSDYKRVTGYDYNQSSVIAIGDILYYDNTYTIPGNNRSAFGFIEESKNITGNFKGSEKIYDARGNLIKIRQFEELQNTKQNVTEESDDLNSVLFDITGFLEVAQFFPYEMQYHEVGYYGFEDYEINQIGAINSTNQNRWYFNETDVVKEKFSLTGQNYLNLSNSRLLGTFIPRNQNETYVASCWVRSQEKSFKIGEIAPYLKAVVYDEDNQEINGYLGEVKFQYDNWYYLEVLVDFLLSKYIFRNLITNSSLTSEDDNSMSTVRPRKGGLVFNSNSTEIKPFKIIITVSPNINSTLDVDHIRFSPLNSNFQATVYNFKTKEIKEVLNANGLIKRYFYNKYQDKIGSINEDGEIEKLVTYTKTSSIKSIVNLKSMVSIKPTQGFHEDFNPHAFVRRWEVYDKNNWKISPGELHHRSDQIDQLKLRNMQTTFDSYGIRLYFSLQSEFSGIKFNDVLQLNRKDNEAIITFLKKTQIIPAHGEILLISERSRLMVWIEGGLYFDEGGLDKSLFDIKMYGAVKISDMFFFTDPSVHITYFNSLGEKVQEIILEPPNSAIITEILYDELGRQNIVTKATRLQRSANQSVAAYYSNIVINQNPLSENSVWKINRLEGEFEILKPYDFYQVTYNDNPLNEESSIGLPGQEFSVVGSLAKRFSSNTKNLFITKHYPLHLNYKYRVEHKLGGIDDIKVYNSQNDTVAWLVDVPGKSDLLATYEYNNNRKLIKTLSPLYHKKAGTLDEINSDFQFFNRENSASQRPLRLEFGYDKMGNLINKTTPDSGKVEFLYNDKNILKFGIYYSQFNITDIENVIYYDYDYLGRLNSTGKLISPPAKEELLNLSLTKNNTEKYQVFYHNEFEKEPTLRGRLDRSITYNEGIPFIEENLLNGNGNVLSKRIIAINENSEEPWIISTNKIYRAGKVREIEYPVNVQGKPFKVTYSYDRLGQIKEIGVPEKNNLFIDFTYNPTGQIETENHLPDRINFNFTRKYYYNSATFLTRLEDKFLTENIHYAEGSYGGRGFGDGTITRTEFKADWHDYADSSKLGLNETSFANNYMDANESKLCFQKLKEAGYINQYHRQAKIFYPSLEVDFPIVCTSGITGQQIQNVLGEQGFPSIYGHLYDYGAYNELIKAKYFVGNEIPEPLQHDTFAKKIHKINLETSRNIWKILIKYNFVIVEKTISEENYFKPQGKKGNQIIRSTLSNDFKTFNNYQNYLEPLQQFLSSYFSKKQDLSLFKSNLKKAFLNWSQHGKEKTEKKVPEHVVNDIIEMLEKKGYFKNPLDQQFNESLKEYQFIIPELVSVLLEHFGKQLGKAEFDFQAHMMDENGNHKVYYSGSGRYQLIYRNNSNQIKSINVDSYNSKRSFPIEHDSRGNVIQALHKGIKNIMYHSVSNRASSINLVDGRQIIFYYDNQGERVLKRVLDVKGEIKKEIHYIRDEFGRSLVEREMIWSSPNLPPSILITVFIYGPKGMIGFIRRDEYYSVITDHEGSTRLIVKDGEVVAAYDYLPYGNLMRHYASYSEANIAYRYTGQEWDEETGLYNYHARFYDPIIGRFYQHDPEMQYFSPYKYAGNSPVSMMDPNGEFAFMLAAGILAGILFGGYLAGAAYSNTWNALKWDFKNLNLYLSILTGAVTGALLPGIFEATVFAFTAFLNMSVTASYIVTVILGGIGVYIYAGRATNEWDPRQWDWDNPQLWNAAFNGFAMFVSIPSVLHQSLLYYLSFSTVIGKTLILSAYAVSGAANIAYNLAGKNLDFSKPEVYLDILEGIIHAPDIPITVTSGFRLFKKQTRNIIKGIKYSFKPLNVLFKSSGKFLLAGALPLAFGMGAMGVFSENGTDFTSPKSYMKFLIGAGYGRSAKKFIKGKYEMLSHANKNQYSLTSNQKNINSNVIVDKYVGMIQDLEFFEEPYVDISQNLEIEDVSNQVVTAARTEDDMAFVAYYGREGPGFLSSFHKKENDFIGYDPEKPDVPRKIAVNDDENINHLIVNALENRRNVLVELNYDKYESEKANVTSFFVEKTLPSLSPTLKSYFNETEVFNILNKLGEEIQIVGYVHSREKMANVILTPISRKNAAFNSLKNILNDFNKIKLSNQITQLIVVEKETVALETKVGLPERKIDLEQEFSEKRDMLNTRLNKLQQMRNKVTIDLEILRQEVNKQFMNFDLHTGKNAISTLWKEYFQKYFDKFTNWSPTIYDDDIALSLISKRPQMFPAHVGPKYDLEDFRYSTAYTITHNRKILESEPITRCSDCQETLRTVKTIITDLEWGNLIEIERKKLKDITCNEGLYFAELNFFMPHYDFTFERTENESSRVNCGSLKKKRSTFGNNISNENLLIQAIDNATGNSSKIYKKRSLYEENRKSITSTEKKSKNITNNIFGWLRTSVNQLFNTNKVLPAKSSNTVLGGITDSNNNMTSVTALVDVNSTILLLDTMIRKVTGQKYSSAADTSTSLLDARVYSLDVGLAFEKTMQYAASKSKISMHRFNIHYLDIQENVIDKIMSGKLDEIAAILILHAEKACPLTKRDCSGKLSPKKFKKFIEIFSKRIDEELNQILQRNKIINE